MSQRSQLKYSKMVPPAVQPLLIKEQIACATGIILKCHDLGLIWFNSLFIQGLDCTRLLLEQSSSAFVKWKFTLSLLSPAMRLYLCRCWYTIVFNVFVHNICGLVSVVMLLCIFSATGNKVLSHLAVVIIIYLCGSERWCCGRGALNDSLVVHKEQLAQSGLAN